MPRIRDFLLLLICIVAGVLIACVLIYLGELFL